MCAGMVPYDGIPSEETISINAAVTALFVILATAGVAFTVICLLFNIIFRNSK